MGRKDIWLIQNTGDVFCFFLRKQYRRKLWAGEIYQFCVVDMRNFPAPGNETKTDHCENVDKVWWKNERIFRTVLKAYPSFANFEFFLQCTPLLPPPQESQCCSFHGIGLQICPTMWKGVFFPLSQIIPMVDPFCTKPRINNTNVASAQLWQHNMALQLIWYMNYEDSSLSIKTTYVQLYLKRCCRNLFAAMYGANYKRSDPELG